MKFPTRGLYAITQTEGKSAETILQEVSSAIQGGVHVIQYRNKQNTDVFTLAKALQSLCNRHKIPFIINDDVELAASVKADGVHLGRHDGSIARARKQLGAKAIIGQSCYDDVELAKKAQSEGADYVAFGRFFPSNSKPLALPAHQETLLLAKKTIQVPIVAIGGILPENGQALLASGADVLAVIGGIFDHDPASSARHYQKLFVSSPTQ
ncbi:MAG: thiamine phosphate synthase [Methylococcales bacterium]